VTCSVLDEENGAQIRNFVGRHPDFSVEKPAEVANALGERAYMFSKAALVSGEGVLMTPRRPTPTVVFCQPFAALCMTSAAHARQTHATVLEPSMDHHDKILIVDFGSQVTQLIARRVREEKVYSEIVPYQKAAEAFARMKPTP